MLKEAMRSKLAPLRNCAATGFEFSLRARKIWRCYSKLVSYCCDILGAEDMSSIRHGADEYHPCVMCTVRFEDMIRGWKSSSCLFSDVTETRGKVKSSKVIRGMMIERGQKGRKR